MKSLQKEQKAQITEYKPQSAGINLQSPQSDSTPWTLTLIQLLKQSISIYKNTIFFSYTRQIQVVYLKNGDFL